MVIGGMQETSEEYNLFLFLTRFPVYNSTNKVIELRSLIVLEFLERGLVILHFKEEPGYSKLNWLKRSTIKRCSAYMFGMMEDKLVFLGLNLSKLYFLHDIIRETLMALRENPNLHRGMHNIVIMSLTIEMQLNKGLA